MFKDRWRLKSVCKNCGAVEYKSTSQIIINTIFHSVVMILAVFGAMFFGDMLRNGSTISGFYLSEQITDTRMVQMAQMADDYSDDWDLSFYAYNILYTAAFDMGVPDLDNITDIGKIHYLHQAVNTETLYLTDDIINGRKDVLYSPLITMSRGGDCEDRAVLFLTLAKIANLTCYPALTDHHALAYCIYDKDRIVFVDCGTPELGLDRELVDDVVILYKEVDDEVIE